MSYRFHASAPPGEWINDPNALFFADGRYRLYAQHAADAPAFERVGWGRFTSPDLLDWRWEGVAVPPDGGGRAYSGSVVVTDGTVEAFLTRHRPDAEPRQVQVRRALAPGAVDSAPVGPAGRNRRDPFVFRCPATDDWRMLVAEPCDWEAWRGADPSRLSVWRSLDRIGWEPAGMIGPWRPPGVLWEVPVLLDFGTVQLLIVSEVDRRGGEARCSVRYWPGRFDGAAFTPAEGTPETGRPVDLGPDFYAAIPNVEAGWPGRERVLVAWASNWATARRLSWPEARGGGPISLPRLLSWDAEAERLRQRPVPAAERFRSWTGRAAGSSFRLQVRRDSSELLMIADRGGVSVTRTGSAELAWEDRHDIPVADDAAVDLYADGPLIELFLPEQGLALTAILPGDGEPYVRLGS